MSLEGLSKPSIICNASPAQLYELCLAEDGGVLTAPGAIGSSSGKKTGRSPKDKRVVARPGLTDDIWWGSVNVELSPDAFDSLREHAISSLNTCPKLYVVDGYAGWQPSERIKVRVITSRPYHALFMYNMLIRPSREELASFGEPDFTIYNAGQFKADPSTPGLTSDTCVALDFESRQLVILGTMYAGEMKKGVFTVMNYLLPREGMPSMHCSANEGMDDGDVSLFFGLSGTGKTTLSADPRRRLIGDDEHGWGANGIFNIEGGCYAKCVNLSPEGEPEIYAAIRFGAILENVVVDPETREIDYEDISITENTRVSYPIEFIPNSKTPCVGSHPRNVIFLACDAFGVLPPVSKLSPAQMMYHFMSGYTAKVAGTEIGVTEPSATFSACYGAAFLVWHPAKYAHLLADKSREHNVDAWLVNTGWAGGAHGVGSRIKLAYTRAIIDAIHDGSLAKAPMQKDPIFGVEVPQTCAGVPSELLVPANAWKDKAAFTKAATKLAQLFQDNFKKYADGADAEIIAAGPKV
jgi:phosphoenolpyruvate carboxykinase (ATP)